jgi:hypothetical protein
MGSPSAAGTVSINKTLVQSSGMTYLPVEEAEQLIDYIVDESKLLQEATVVKMKYSTKRLAELTLGTKILRKSGVGACVDSGSADITKKELVSKSFKAVITVGDDWIEDNPEGEEGLDHLMRAFADQLRNELEILTLMGSLPANIFYDDADMDTTTMRAWNGWYAQMRLASPVLDGATAGDGRCLTICKLKQLIQELPNKFKRRRQDLRIYMSMDLWLDYVKLVSDRLTVLGDKQLTDADLYKFGGIEIVPVPLIPQDVDSCVSGTISPADGTFMFITPKWNLVLGIQREIRYERQRDACNEETKHIFTLRADPMVINEDAAVLYDCLQICECPAP